MSRVAQLSFDVVLEDNEDSSKYLDRIDDFIERKLNKECLGYGADDVSEQYREQGYLVESLASETNIRLEGYIGTWYVISKKIHEGKMLYLLENEMLGDSATGIIIDANKNIILDDVYNGFDDLEDLQEEE